MYSGAQAAADTLLEEQQRRLAECKDKPSILRAGRSRAVLRAPAPPVVVKAEGDSEGEEDVVQAATKPRPQAQSFVLPLTSVVSFKTPELAATQDSLQATLYFTSNNATITQLKNGDNRFAVSHALQHYLHATANQARIADPLLHGDKRQQRVGEEHDTALAHCLADVDLANLMVTDILDVSVTGTDATASAVPHSRHSAGQLGARVKVTIQLSEVTHFSNSQDHQHGSSNAASCHGISYGTVVGFPYTDAIRVKLSDACGGNTILVRCPDDEPLRDGEVVLLTVEPGCIRAQCQTPHRAMGHWSCLSHEQNAGNVLHAAKAKKSKKSKATDSEDLDLDGDDSDSDSSSTTSSSSTGAPTSRSKRTRDDEDEKKEVVTTDKKEVKRTQANNVDLTSMSWEVLQLKLGVTKKKPNTALVDTLEFSWFTKEEKDDLYDKWREKKRLRDLGPEAAAKEEAEKKQKKKQQAEEQQPVQDLTMAGVDDDSSDDDENNEVSGVSGGVAPPTTGLSRKVRFPMSSDSDSDEDEGTDRHRNGPSSRVGSGLAVESDSDSGDSIG